MLVLWIEVKKKFSQVNVALEKSILTVFDTVKLGTSIENMNSGFGFI